jgi:hypothetical protein
MPAPDAGQRLGEQRMSTPPIRKETTHLPLVGHWLAGGTVGAYSSSGASSGTVVAALTTYQENTFRHSTALGS